MRVNRPRNGHNNGAQNNEQFRKIGTHQTQDENGNNQDYLPNDYDFNSTLYNYKNILKIGDYPKPLFRDE